MKVYNLKTTLILLLIFTHTLTKAQNTITVNNTPNVTCNYKTLQGAVDAAKPGDTIYVQQSNIPYEKVEISKRLHIRGRSHSLENYKTLIKGIIFFNGSNNSSLMSSSTNISFDLSIGSIENIRIINNKISSISLANKNEKDIVKNLTLQGNVITVSGEGTQFFTNFKNILITNNIISSSLYFENNGNVSISNNIFYNGFTINPVIKNFADSQINVANSIFICNADGVSCSENSENITYNNCIAYNYNSTGSYTFANDDDTKAINCLDNTDPKFKKVNTTSNSASIAGSGEFNPKDDDVHLQSNAPKANVGVYWIAQ